MMQKFRKFIIERPATFEAVLRTFKIGVRRRKRIEKLVDEVLYKHER